MTFDLNLLISTLAIGYLLGSIPFGLILTRMAGLGDVRTIGSGNIGATNVLRTGNKKLAALTLFLDLVKGTAAVLLCRYLFTEQAGLIAGLAAFLGHLFPVWLGFKGGKGVATYIGVILGIFWPSALAFGAIWLFVAWLTRYSSLSALVASALIPIIFLFLNRLDAALAIFLMTVLVYIRHHANIRRLLSGQETKIGAK